ncbi:hypothetical protein BDR04DRAFT_94985 [Suillus decipiens]|nr:hypothetical protein BDR04DRAFT_94985 [Suillus decipiens]
MRTIAFVSRSSISHLVIVSYSGFSVGTARDPSISPGLIISSGLYHRFYIFSQPCANDYTMSQTTYNESRIPETCSVLGVPLSLIHSILLQFGYILTSAIIQASSVLALNCNKEIHVWIT